MVYIYICTCVTTLSTVIPQYHYSYTFSRLFSKVEPPGVSFKFAPHELQLASWHHSFLYKWSPLTIQKNDGYDDDELVIGLHGFQTYLHIVTVTLAEVLERCGALNCYWSSDYRLWWLCNSTVLHCMTTCKTSRGSVALEIKRFALTFFYVWLIACSIKFFCCCFCFVYKITMNCCTWFRRDLNSFHSLKIKVSNFLFFLTEYKWADYQHSCCPQVKFDPF